MKIYGMIHVLNQRVRVIEKRVHFNKDLLIPPKIIMILISQINNIINNNQ